MRRGRLLDLCRSARRLSRTAAGGFLRATIEANAQLGHLTPSADALEELAARMAAQKPGLADRQVAIPPAWSIGAVAPPEALPARGLDLQTTTPGFDMTIYGAEDASAIKARMQEIMTDKVGIFRTGKDEQPSEEETSEVSEER